MWGGEREREGGERPPHIAGICPPVGHAPGLRLALGHGLNVCGLCVVKPVSNSGRRERERERETDRERERERERERQRQRQRASSTRAFNQPHRLVAQRDTAVKARQRDKHKCTYVKYGWGLRSQISCSRSSALSPTVSYRALLAVPSVDCVGGIDREPAAPSWSGGVPERVTFGASLCLTVSLCVSSERTEYST